MAEKERKKGIVLERNSGPRLEERNEEKDKRKVAKVITECAGTAERQDTWRQTASKGVGA